MIVGTSFWISLAVSKPEGWSDTPGGGECPLLGSAMAPAGTEVVPCTERVGEFSVGVNFTIPSTNIGVEFQVSFPGIPVHGYRYINLYECVGWGEYCVLGSVRREPGECLT